MEQESDTQIVELSPRNGLEERVKWGMREMRNATNEVIFQWGWKLAAGQNIFWMVWHRLLAFFKTSLSKIFNFLPKSNFISEAATRGVL